MALGRPTTYTEEIAQRICEELADGVSIVKICKAKGMPAVSTVFLWLAKNDHFSEIYDLAKQAALENLAEEILEIGDNTSESIHDRRLRTDLRKWNLARLAPQGRKNQKNAEDPVTQGDLESALAEIVDALKGGGK